MDSLAPPPEGRLKDVPLPAAVEVAIKGVWRNIARLASTLQDQAIGESQCIQPQKAVRKTGLRWTPVLSVFSIDLTET